MNWMEVAQLAGAVAVPLVAVAGLFYGMMSARLKPFEEDIKALRVDVHALDVRLARLEERLER